MNKAKESNFECNKETLIRRGSSKEEVTQKPDYLGCPATWVERLELDIREKDGDLI